MAFKVGAIKGEAILDTAKWTGGLKTMSKSTSSFVKVAAGALVTGMTVSIAKANEFQKEMSNVSTVIDTSVISTQEMTKELLRLDPALGTTTELTKGLYNAYSAGAETMEEAIQVTTDSAKFATAALTDNATAVDVLTTATNAYGKDIMNSTRASDIFFTTIKQGKITGEQLAGSIGQSIPLYASMGIEMEQLASGMAAMTKQGISANEATTQLNAIVNSFIKPSTDLSESLQAIGFESGAAFIEAEGLTGALAFLEEATGGNAAALGTLIPNVRGLKGVMALTGVGGKEYTRVLQEMESATGATDEAFGKQEKTFRTLKNQMDSVSIVAGNIGKFFVDEIAEGATEAATSMLTFVTSSQGMELISNIIGGAATTFELLETVLSRSFGTLLPIVRDLFIEIGSQIAQTAKVTGEGVGAFDLLGGVIQFSSSALKIAGQALTGWVKGIGASTRVMLSLGNTIGTFFKILKGEATFDDLKNNVSESGSLLKDLGDEVLSFWGGLGTVIKDETKSFLGNTKDLNKEIKSSFTVTFGEVKNGVKSNYDEMITGQDDFIGQMLEGNQDLINSIMGSNSELESNTKKTYTGLLGTIKEFISNAKFEWRGLYDSIISSVSFGIESLSEITSMSNQNELDKLEINTQGQLADLEYRYEQGLLTTAQYEEQKGIIEAQALERENELRRKQFESQKRFNIGQVWIDAAGAIMGWWSAAASLGPIAGPIFAGSMTAATIATAGKQTSLISEQQYIPAREKGGMAGGMTRVNESGGEIITLPDGSQVIPNDISTQIADNIMGGSGDTIINFYDTIIQQDTDIDEVADKVSRVLGTRLKGAS